MNLAQRSAQLALRAAIAGLRELRSAAAGLADAAVPQTCVACRSWMPGDGPEPLCEPCSRQLGEASIGAACRRCGRPLPSVLGQPERCRGCRSEDFWNVAGIVRVATYRDATVRQLVAALKYGGDLRAADLMAERLAGAIRAAGWPPIDLFVPVPMHWMRRWQRPVDHAAALAGALGQRLRARVKRAAVRRPGYAPSQTELYSRAARFDNVRGCFATSRRPGVEGRVVCIVDNILLSGATLHEVSKALRRAKPAAIYAAVFARSAEVAASEE